MEIGRWNLREIGNDVYACLQPDRGLGWSNSGLINRGGGARRRHLLGSAAHAPDDRALRPGVEDARRVGSSTPITTAITAGATSCSRAPRSSGTALCAAAFGKEQPRAMQALRDARELRDPMLADFRRRPARVRLQRYRADAADDLVRRAPGSRSRRCGGRACSTSDPRTPSATSSSTCPSSASSSPATSCSACARRSAGRAPSPTGSPRSTASSRCSPRSSSRATARSAESRARAR